MNQKGFPWGAAIILVLILGVGLVTFALFGPLGWEAKEWLKDARKTIEYTAETIRQGERPAIGGEWNIQSIQSCPFVKMNDICAEYEQGKGFWRDSDLVNYILILSAPVLFSYCQISPVKKMKSTFI